MKSFFHVSSLDKFYQKINFYLSIEKGKNKLNQIIERLLYALSIMDEKFVENLKNKYPFLNKLNFNWPAEYDELLQDMGVYIINHTNKKISGETIANAVTEVYHSAYGYTEEDAKHKVIEIMEDNSEMFEKHFPKRYSEDSNGNQTIVSGGTNKFALVLEQSYSPKTQAIIDEYQELKSPPELQQTSYHSLLDIITNTNLTADEKRQLIQQL